MKQRARRRRSGLSWYFAALLSTRALGAQPPPSTIILTFDASSEAQKQAIGAIRAHVSDLPAAVEIVPIEHQHSLDSQLTAAGSLAASRRALGSFYIEIERDGTLLVFFTEPAAEATLIRRLPPSRQGIGVAVEQAAIVVRSLVEALLEGGNVGIGPAAARGATPPNEASASRADSSLETPSPASPNPESTPRPEEPEEPEDTAESSPGSGSEGSSETEPGIARLAITAGYTGTDFASGMPWQSGFSGGLQWLATPLLYAGARYTLFPSYTVATDDAVVSVARRPLEALIGYHGPTPLAFNAEFGLLVDAATRTTVSTAAGLRATSPSTRWMLAATARAGLSWSPWSRLRASVRAGADLVLTRYSYTIDSAVAVPTPHPLRPRIELELAAGIW